MTKLQRLVFYSPFILRREHMAGVSWKNYLKFRNLIGFVSSFNYFLLFFFYHLTNPCPVTIYGSTFTDVRTLYNARILDIIDK